VTNDIGGAINGGACRPERRRVRIFDRFLVDRASAAWDLSNLREKESDRLDKIAYGSA
jgi:hypothetical protein